MPPKFGRYTVIIHKESIFSLVLSSIKGLKLKNKFPIAQIYSFRNFIYYIHPFDLLIIWLIMLYISTLSINSIVSPQFTFESDNVAKLIYQWEGNRVTVAWMEVTLIYIIGYIYFKLKVDVIYPQGDFRR